MAAKPMLNEPSSIPVLMGKEVPMLCGIPMKTLILSYHVVAILMLLKLTMFDNWLKAPYFVFYFGLTLVSYIRIDADDKVYVKYHFWICLLLCSIPATIIHIALIGNILNMGYHNQPVEITIEHFIIASIFLALCGVYVWICHEFYQYLYKKPAILPFRSQDVYQVHLNSHH